MPKTTVNKNYGSILRQDYIRLALSQDVGHRLRVHELMAKTVQVQVRGNDLFGSQFQCKMPIRSQLPRDIAETAFGAFKKMPNRTADLAIASVALVIGNFLASGKIPPLLPFISNSCR